MQAYELALAQHQLKGGPHPEDDAEREDRVLRWHAAARGPGCCGLFDAADALQGVMVAMQATLANVLIGR
jgi:hypothetical protein